jgi:hypothetical protein
LVERGSLPSAEPTAAATYQPSAADLSAASLLATAREALARLDEIAPLPGAPALPAASQAEINAVDRDVLFSTALTALTALYQLHGCRWAPAPLRALY